MPIATLHRIHKSFGRRVLFDGASLNIYRGQRIGLVGANGSGKSTLMRILIGQMVPEAGEASIRKGLRAGYLPQDPAFEPGQSVIDEAELAFEKLHQLAHRLRDIEHEMAHQAGDELERTLKTYQNVQQQFEVEGGHAWRHRVEATLLGVGLPQSVWEQDVSTLSGGQRSRLALAKLLVQEPDLLLLDEPTNHLDLEAIEWLEDYLDRFSGAVLLISHDRFLLDRLCSRIAWVHRGKLSAYDGNYSQFIQQRELLELTQMRQYEQQQEEIAKTQEFVRRFSAGQRAKEAKGREKRLKRFLASDQLIGQVQQQEDIAKTQEFIRRFSAGQRAKEAKGREKRLKRFLASDQLIGQVQQQKTIHLSFSTDQRAGDQVLSVRELSKGYDGKALWQKIGFDVRRGERIGIVGPNGSGKTTLLEALIGLRDADEGKIRWGANLDLGYYDQDFGDLDEDKTVLEQVQSGRPELGLQPIRDMLGAMLFSDESVEKRIAVLSGGERARVRLAELLLDRPNVLLLDEPTNHLDIASREALENTLKRFEGTIVCVSHDRYFLKQVCRRMMILRPPGLVDFPGSYEQWQQRQQQEQEQARQREAADRKPSPKAAAEKPKASPSPRKNNPYLRPFGRLSLEQLEHEIHQAEAGILECEVAFADPQTFKDAGKAKELQEEYDGLKHRLKQLEEEYFSREA